MRDIDTIVTDWNGSAKSEADKRRILAELNARMMDADDNYAIAGWKREG